MKEYLETKLVFTDFTLFHFVKILNNIKIVLKTLSAG